MKHIFSTRHYSLLRQQYYSTLGVLLQFFGMGAILAAAVLLVWGELLLGAATAAGSTIPLLGSVACFKAGYRRVPKNWPWPVR